MKASRIQIDLAVRVDLHDLSARLTTDQLNALMMGIAGVLATVARKEV